MTEKIDANWLLITLEDAAETLNAAIERLNANPKSALGVMEHEIPELYAKLNYAVNTAESGPADLETADHDALIAWPESMPFDRKGENKEADEE